MDDEQPVDDQDVPGDSDDLLDLVSLEAGAEQLQVDDEQLVDIIQDVLDDSMIRSILVSLAG